MSVFAPKEIQGIQKESKTNVIEFVPKRDEKLRTNIVPHAQQIVGTSFTQEHAIPSGAQPIPINKNGTYIQAGINTESSIDTKDMLDIAGNTVVHTMRSAGDLLSGEESKVPSKTVSGHKGTSKLKEMIWRKLHLKKAA